MDLSYDDKEFPVRCAAVCVYPSRVKDAAVAIDNMNLKNVINIASGIILLQYYFIMHLICY